MGTRSLTKVYDEGEIVLVMYRQMDGYPSGHGAELARFLDGLTIVNGIGINTPAKAANGMGCLAAQIVAHFKDGIGGIYLMPADAGDEEYVYEVRVGEVRVSGAVTTMSMQGDDRFAGTPAQFLEKFEEVRTR
jgi:hypothetical protein